VLADEHAFELHHIVPPFDPVLDPTGNRVFGGEVEAVLVTETVEAAPLPATTELSLCTHNRNQHTITPPERIKEKNKTYHQTVEPRDVSLLPQLLEGRNGRTIGLKGRASKFLGPNLLLWKRDRHVSYGGPHQDRYHSLSPADWVLGYTKPLARSCSSFDVPFEGDREYGLSPWFLGVLGVGGMSNRMER
jgi:hypothetical protein